MIFFRFLPSSILCGVYPRLASSLLFGWADGGSDWEEWAYAGTSRAAVDEAAMGSGRRVGRRQRAAAMGSGGRVGRRQRVAVMGSGGWVGTREKPAGGGDGERQMGREKPRRQRAKKVLFYFKYFIFGYLQ